MPDLLDKVKEIFLRDAAVASEVKNHHDNMQDQSGSGTPLSTINNSGKSGKDTSKHKNSHMITRSSIEVSGGGGGESLVPLGELNEINGYIAQSLPIVLECLGELLKGNPGPVPRDDSGTPGQWQGGGGYSDTPGKGQGGYSLTPEYVIRVSEEGQITANTFLNATELYRRRLLSELRYKFVLIVNGKAVTHSEFVELRHPSLIAEINQYFELRLLYEPTDLAIDIIAVNIGPLSCLKKGGILYLFTFMTQTVVLLKNNFCF